MKFGKDEIQKMFLGGLMLAVLLYCYFEMLLGPLNDKWTKADSTIKTKTPQIATAKEIIMKAQSLKAKADEARVTVNQAEALIPDGSPVAWFPPLITDFFKRQGIEKCNVHRGEEGMDKELPDYHNLTWGLDISHVEVVPLASAIAAFENEHPLMEISNLQIDSGKENVQYQTARLSISTIIKQ
jgi:hypothetical protein